MTSRATNTIELKKLMIDRRLETITELSQASGVTRNTLSLMLSGKTNPSSEVIGKLISALDISPALVGEIFFGSKLTQ